MKIEDFKLSEKQDLENINPFVSFTCGEYEKQIMGEMTPNSNFNMDVYKNLGK